mmetsp:Transcript_25181/g.63926  ORF Transcript_25181/g.63926 Transcript_25181/m.63926 type:complete len:356 (-) Transcript_25181:478-1545(-)
MLRRLHAPAAGRQVHAVRGRPVRLRQPRRLLRVELLGLVRRGGLRWPGDEGRGLRKLRRREGALRRARPRLRGHHRPPVRQLDGQDGPEGVPVRRRTDLAGLRPQRQPKQLHAGEGEVRGMQLEADERTLQAAPLPMGAEVRGGLRGRHGGPRRGRDSGPRRQARQRDRTAVPRGGPPHQEQFQLQGRLHDPRHEMGRGDQQAQQATRLLHREELHHGLQRHPRWRCGRRDDGDQCVADVLQGPQVPAGVDELEEGLLPDLPRPGSLADGGAGMPGAGSAPGLHRGRRRGALRLAAAWRGLGLGRAQPVGLLDAVVRRHKPRLPARGHALGHGRREQERRLRPVGSPRAAGRQRV